MKIAHEAPLSIYDRVQSLTDYDYALVHLFEENEKYYDKFYNALHYEREVILDNSIFELGTAFDSDRFAYWVERLHPTYYIIPDVLEDAQGTIVNFDQWQQTYKQLPGKTIAVAQGKTYQEFIDCYLYLVNKVDKIAISFDYSFFNDWMEVLDNKQPTRYHEWMIGRQLLIKTMLKDGHLKENVPHHLLGCGLPQEFKDYRKCSFVDSLDTSNPVIHGLKGILYTENGLENKESVKLFTLMNEDVTERWNEIEHNIKMFRGFCFD
jgi:hypothetical protein